MIEVVKITLKDGSIKEYSDGITVRQVTEDISQGLLRVALAGEVNGKVVDLRYGINKDATLNILTFNDEGGRLAYRHTTSHIMAQAVKRLFKDVKLAIGPAIDNGFYYDFDYENSFTAQDLEEIEKEIREALWFSDLSWETTNQLNYLEKKSKEELNTWKESKEKEVKTSYKEY